ncbi:MAG: hypothetical protein Q7T80_10060 [Methanoregula sp.]|nr:hypothetical protein [Methanoregula sp.]
MLIVLVTEVKIPFDFVIDDRGCVSLVRVRRLKYSQFGSADIQRSCGQEIKALRELPIPEGIYRELWVRGADRRWYRYLVHKDGIEVLENNDDGKEENSLRINPIFSSYWVQDNNSPFFTKV